MNKEESINKLKEFHLLINNYFDGKYEDEKTIKFQINIILPIIQELVKNANCLKLMTMTPPPAIGGMIIQNFNPFDMIFHSFCGISIIPNIRDMIEQSIGKYENDLVDFKELKNVKIIKKCKIEYTDKITFKWLYDNVPLKIWLTFFSLLIGTFLLGYQTHNFFDKSNIQNINILKK